MINGVFPNANYSLDLNGEVLVVEEGWGCVMNNTNHRGCVIDGLRNDVYFWRRRVNSSSAALGEPSQCVGATCINPANNPRVV